MKVESIYLVSRKPRLHKAYSYEQLFNVSNRGYCLVSILHVSFFLVLAEIPCNDVYVPRGPLSVKVFYELSSQ